MRSLYELERKRSSGNCDVVVRKYDVMFKVLRLLCTFRSDRNINDAHSEVRRYPDTTMAIKIYVLQLPDFKSDSHIKHPADVEDYGEG